MEHGGRGRRSNWVWQRIEAHRSADRCPDLQAGSVSGKLWCNVADGPKDEICLLQLIVIYRPSWKLEY